MLELQQQVPVPGNLQDQQLQGLQYQQPVQVSQQLHDQKPPYVKNLQQQHQVSQQLPDHQLLQLMQYQQQVTQQLQEQQLQCMQQYQQKHQAVSQQPQDLQQVMKYHHQHILSKQLHHQELLLHYQQQQEQLRVFLEQKRSYELYLSNLATTLASLTYAAPKTNYDAADHPQKPQAFSLFSYNIRDKNAFCKSVSEPQEPTLQYAATKMMNPYVFFPTTVDEESAPTLKVPILTNC